MPLFGQQIMSESPLLRQIKLDFIRQINMEDKLFIKNRKGQKLSIIVDKTPKQKGLVFVMHGLSGFKEQEHLITIAEAFKEKKFTVVRFDTTNTLGESEGSIDKATTTNYYEDLEDVISWAENQKWYKEPFALTGHSLGGICTSMYAQKYPRKVSLLAPISTVVSGKLVIESFKRYEKENFEQLARGGWLEKAKFKEIEIEKKVKKLKRLARAFIRDCSKYNLLSEVAKLTMPVLLIVGENDKSTPADHIEILYQAMPEPKELCIIKNAPHTFIDKKHLKEIKKILSLWIKKYAVK